MRSIALTYSYADFYEAALFQLAEIDAGVYGQQGQKYRAELMGKISLLRVQACGTRSDDPFGGGPPDGRADATLC